MRLSFVSGSLVQRRGSAEKGPRKIREVNRRSGFVQACVYKCDLHVFLLIWRNADFFMPPQNGLLASRRGLFSPLRRRSFKLTLSFSKSSYRSQRSSSLRKLRKIGIFLKSGSSRANSFLVSRISLHTFFQFVDLDPA